MSEAAKAARAANKAKAARLAAGEPKAKVDASSWTPPEMMNTEKKTGLRPISRRAFKRGGKVHGEAAPQNAGRKARKGSGDLPTQIAESHSNRNVKEANAQFGKPHTGGYASGGYAKGGKLKRKEFDEELGASQKKVRDFGSSEISDKQLGRGLMKYAPSRYVSNLASSKGEKDPMDGMKKGGRAKKMGGGAMGDPRVAAADRMAAANQQAGVPSGRMSFVQRQGTPLPGSGMKKGGRAGKAAGGKEMSQQDKGPAPGGPMDLGAREPDYKRGGKIKNFEGSAKDEAQDKKLAAKRGMSMKEWETSEADEKHDQQQSMKGLKSGGHVKGCMCKMCGGRAGRATGGKTGDGFYQGTRPTGGRIAKAGGGLIEGLMGGLGAAAAKKMERASGGRTKKGKTNINIVINAGQKPTDPMAGMPMPMLPPGKPPMLPPAMSAGAPAPAGGPPMPPEAGGGGAPAGGGLGALLGRKSGGRVGNRSYSSYKDMDAGAGSGLGRLEKTEIAKKTYKK